MRIGFLLPAAFAVGNPGNGIRAQAEQQAAALEELGCTVLRLDPWQRYDLEDLDVVEFFLGGPAHHGIEAIRDRCGVLAFAPIIDSNEPNWSYRLAVRFGRLHAKVFTIPGILQAQAESSDLVIARSSHERDRLTHGLGTDPAKVRIILNGASCLGTGDANRARRRHDLPDEFVLHVSAYTQPRKNVVRMIEAIGPTDLPLVIAGHAPPGPGLEAVRKAAERFPNVRLLGWQDRQALEDLYASCKVFCLPSMHEGTGLVALEAGAYGARVVVTRHGGPSDYFSDRAWYVWPERRDSIREAVVAAFNAVDARGLAAHIRSNLTWRHSAEALLRSYQEAAQATSGTAR